MELQINQISLFSLLIRSLSRFFSSLLTCYLQNTEVHLLEVEEIAVVAVFLQKAELGNQVHILQNDEVDLVRRNIPRCSWI